MSPVATPMANPKNESPFCRYRGFKLDVEIIDIVKAAALILGLTAQEWASNVLNEAASEIIKRDPIVRKPPAPPKPKGGYRKRGRPSKS